MRLLICLTILMLPRLATAQQYALRPVQTDASFEIVGSPTFAAPLHFSFDFNQAANTPLIEYLSREQVRKQFDFSDDQTKEFKQLKDEFGEAIQRIQSKFPELNQKGLPKAERSALTQKVKIESDKLKEEFGDKVREVLVPRQLDLIESTRFNQKVQFVGFSKAISDGPFAEDLKTTEEQKEELADIKKKADAEIQQAVAAMKAKAKAKMMKVLSTKQKKRVKELEGETDKTKQNTRL